MIYDSETMAGVRALRLWQEGMELACPVCGAMLAVIPEGVQRPKMPLGMFCPKSKGHVHFYGETRGTLESVRGVIRKMKGGE